MQGPEKNSYNEFDNEKKFLQLENSPPLHNFSNGPSLTLFSAIVLICTALPIPPTYMIKTRGVSFRHRII